ncbi:OmpA family protein [Nodosilinea sp. LEGE 06152]|uniref:OmpA family protein n=1 Tax=Nodosilinea sp. LEGE 06152 TaxID=2777966 RepID=UPI00187F6729|nr:OmpA family protein [Nodosilinea sp. LEGE 06152]MBE9156257.1 OmpA family protein [Nodosilinea sp. LEGE 06152]
MADSPDLPPPTSNKTPSAGGSNPVSPAPVAPLPVTPAAADSATRPRSGLGSGLHALWTLVVRLLMLGVGVSFGWIVGMLVAQTFPARSAEPPLTEVALRHSSQTLRKLQQLPQWWRGDRVVGLAAEDSGSDATAAERPPVNDRDRIATDLNTLSQDISNLNTRLKALETTLDLPSTGGIEARFQRLDQRLNADNAAAEAPAAPPATEPPTAAEPPPPAAEPVALTPYQEPRFPLVRDRVVLPSALLFEPGSSILTAPGQQLLDAIVSDLSRYGAATLLVGSHTGATAPEPASQLTLQQSLAVQQHLAPQLEGNGSRWVAVGYGSTRPLATTTSADQSRNQRVEIGIVPSR